MILTGAKIIEEVHQDNIRIDPFDPEMVNPNSYNYRLGSELLLVTDECLDPRRKSSIEVITLGPTGFVLEPRTLYLGSTLEQLGSRRYVTQLIGRSSVGRLGLFLQITAPLGHTGPSHCWTLELTVVQRLRVYPGMKIGQVSFWTVEGGNDLQYSSCYWDYSRPEISRIYRESTGDCRE